MSDDPGPEVGVFHVAGAGRHAEGSALPATNTERAMKDKSPLESLDIDVSAALPSVGDRKKVLGGADLVLRDGFDMDFGPGKSIEWALDLRRIAGAVEISGKVTGDVMLQCYRCLEDFTFPLSIELREHALWLSGGPGEEDEETSPDYLVVDGILDIEPVLRDAVVLAFPARRICDMECKGLCVRCGANLNLEPCTCEARPVDVRLSPLAELKKRMEQDA